MTDATPCQKCWTMLVRTIREADGEMMHIAERCRDVLHAQLAERTKQRDEAVGLAVMFFSWRDPDTIDQAQESHYRAALERLRHE